LSLYGRGARQHLFTESRGCICGSVFVVSSEDARELRRVLGSWLALHPEGQALHGAVHERTTVARARELRAARGQEAERSRIEIRPER
jgi:hypothetical protein